MGYISAAWSPAQELAKGHLSWEWLQPFYMAFCMVFLYFTPVYTSSSATATRKEPRMGAVLEYKASINQSIINQYILV